MVKMKENERHEEKLMIRVRITAHAYAEGEVHDECFDLPEYGIVGSKTMGPLDKETNKRNELYKCIL